MNDKSKKELQLTKELDAMRQRVTGLEELETIHKQKDETLRESEELYRTLIETSPDPIIMYDLSGKILAANTQTARDYGVSSVDEFLGEVKTVFDLLTEDGKANAAANFRRVLAEGASQKNEYIVRLRDGRIITTEINSSIVRTASGEPRAFISVIRDITDRKLAEEKYRLVVENAREAIVVTQDLRLVFVNHAAVDLTGYSEEILTSRPFTKFIHPDDRNMVMENHIKRLKSEEAPPIYSYRVVCRDGSIKWAETNSVIIQWKGKPAVLNFLNDVTERKRAEEELRDSKRMLQVVLDAIPAATFWKNRDLIYLGGNRAWIESTGMKSLEEVVGKSDYDLPWEKEQADAFRKYDRKIIESGIPEYNIIESYLRADGTQAWAKTNKVPLRDADGNIVGILGTYEDITELKQAEDKLKASERQFRSLVESIPIGIFTYEGTKFRYVNPAFEKIAGYTRDELRQIDVWEIVHPEFRDSIREYVHKRQKGEPVPEYHVLDILTKSGEVRWVEGGVIPIEWSEKPSVLIIAMDITERKYAEDVLRKSEEKYRALLENASDAILLADENGNILEVNRKAEELLGYTREELLLMHYTQLHPMVELDRTIEAFKKIVEQGYGTLQDGSIYRKDGKVVPVDITSSIIQYAGIKVVKGSFRDMSEHKHAKDALERLVSERTAELSAKNEQLIMEIKERKRAEASLRKKGDELKLHSGKLEELNAALKVLLKQRDEDKKELEEKVMANVKELLLPYLEELKKGRLDARSKVQVSIIEANMNNIISPFTHRLSSKYSGFTPREIQVANLIRQGKSTKEIAEYLGVSRSAINLYRNGIRSKLGIISIKINLRSHLMSLS